MWTDFEVKGKSLVHYHFSPSPWNIYMTRTITSGQRQLFRRKRQLLISKIDIMVRTNIVIIVLMYCIFIMIGNSTANALALSGQDMTLENNKYDYQDPDLEEYGPLVYDILFFQQFAAVLNETTPFNAGYGIEISSVYMFGNSINFNITCDYLICFCLDLMTEDSAATVKYELALALYGFFDDMGCDDNGDSIVAKMESFGLEFNYFFYVDEYQEAIMSFSITGD